MVLEDVNELDATVQDDVFLIEIGDLNEAVHKGFGEAFRAAYDADTRVVVVTGKGESFMGPTEYDPEYLKMMKDIDYWRDNTMREAEEILESMLNVEQPIIAKVNGQGAHSLGASIALTCDLIIAGDGASFSDPHVSGFGVPAGDGGCVMWPRRIGLARAKEYLLTGKPIHAEEAVEIGLINRVVPEEDLDDEVDELVDTLASSAQNAVRYTKKTLNQYVQHDMNLTWGYGVAHEVVSGTADFHEGIDAVIEGREPDFPSGR